MKKAIYMIVMVILVCVFVFAGYQIYQGLNEYHVIDEYYETAEKYIVSAAPSAESGPEPTVVPTDDMDISTDESVLESDEPAEYAPIAIDFELLTQDCPDTIGWLYAPDGSINLPVVQGDDNKYYLTRLPDGSYSKGGSLFLDYLNAANFTDEISFIYGHNMKNNTMLQPLLQYKKQDYYNTNCILYLLTPEQNFKVELFAGVLTGMESDVYTFFFASTEEKQLFIEDMVSRSTFTPYYVPDVSSNLLCLSTCAYDFDDARYVVFGKLTPIG